jgi:hypothetical protein
MSTANGGAGGAPGFGQVAGATGSASAQSLAQSSIGTAFGQSTAQSGSDSLTTTAQAPAGGPASALAKAGVGASVPGGLIKIRAGQSASYASMEPNGDHAAGAMSAGYGGSGESLTYSAEAVFTFTTIAPEDLYLTLLDNNHTGFGFDSMDFTIVWNYVYLPFSFSTLSDAETWFKNRTFDFGAVNPGSQTVDLFYSLTASRVGDGFGFDYRLAVPEASTWAMMLLGFAVLGFAGWRRARAGAHFAA